LIAINPDGSHKWLCTDVEIIHKNIVAWKSIEGFKEDLPNLLLDKYQAMLDRVEDKMKMEHILVESYPLSSGGKIQAIQQYIRGE